MTQAPGGIAYQAGVVSGRLSPGALERRMTAELNLLESMEESVRQLTHVDRSRGVSLAQQETVSLAQILKVGLVDPRVYCGLPCEPIPVHS